MEDVSPVTARDPLDALTETAPAELLSAVDMARLLELPADKQALAKRRIAVLRGWRSDRRRLLFADASAAAKEAGLKRSGFFRMMKVWEADAMLRLDDLGLYLTQRKPVADDRAERAAAVAREADDLLRERPAKGTAAITRALQQGAGRGMAATTIGRILDEVRLRLPATSAFGERLLLDSASLDIVDQDGRRQRLFAIVDRGTAMLASWAVLPEEDFAAAYRRVLNLAVGPVGVDGGWPTGGRLRLATSPSPTMTIALPIDAEFEFSRSVSDAGWPIFRDPRRMGRELVRALGGDFAGIALSAGFAPPGVSHRSRDVIDLPVVGPLARERFTAAVQEHQDRRIALAMPGTGNPRDVVIHVLQPLLHQGFPV